MLKFKFEKLKDWFGNHREDYILSDRYIIKDFHTKETIEQGSFLSNWKNKNIPDMEIVIYKSKILTDINSKLHIFYVK